MVPPLVPAGAVYRTAWRRDYARLLHCAAFRRLQGKTQLFPSHESDFFRNRLTHSLEVAQIAKSIAIKLNATNEFFSATQAGPIDLDLIETAALAHDLGHPPFGHNGEAALDAEMIDAGGFEGNAQSLRILARIEKRQTLNSEHQNCLDGIDQRAGLNLTYRALASVLKYDNEIPMRREDRDEDSKGHPIKGYYNCERDLVGQIKHHVGMIQGKGFKTIECSIMDIADDIAYSTYDLEDALKGGFLNPLSMIASDQELFTRVASKVSSRLKKAYPSEPKKNTDFSWTNAYLVILATFQKAFDETDQLWKALEKGDVARDFFLVLQAENAVRTSQKMASNGYYRTQLTSDLVNEFVQGVELIQCEEVPALSTIRLNLETLQRVETLKNFVFEAVIMSSTLKVTEHRGRDIVMKIFQAITAPGGQYLMPDDYRELYNNVKKSEDRKRLICDFVAGMTDRYAIRFYGRLFGANPESIHSPL